MTLWKIAPVALLALAAPFAGCTRTVVVQPAPSQQGEPQAQPTQAQQTKNLSDPKAICKVALDARKKTIPSYRAFAEKAPKGSWTWQDDGVNEAANALSDALTAEAGALDGLVGNVGDTEIASDAKDYTRTVKKLADDLQIHAETNSVELQLSTYDGGQADGGLLLNTCYANGYYKK